VTSSCCSASYRASLSPGSTSSGARHSCWRPNSIFCLRCTGWPGATICTGRHCRYRPEQEPSPATAPDLPVRAAPAAPAGLLPRRLSVSGLVSLVACPYQFFARHVLRLNELDEVSEELEKSEYGQLVHRSLERFHAAYPLVSDLDEDEALAALQAIVETTFAAAEADNWLALGWRLRWQNRLPAYLNWQRAREQAGWRWLAAELKVARILPLSDGAEIELYGRIDRVDESAGGRSLIDYKTKSLVSLRKAMHEDIQLPVYALLAEGAVEAAYVVLDDARVASLPCPDRLEEVAAAQGERLVQVFSALHAGAALPAHGADAVCQWCEARGLCRRDHVVEA
jgi:ATP-dependent helicase/nuclease subunit B